MLNLNQFDMVKEQGVIMTNFLMKLRRVKVREFIQIWKLPVSAICALFYRIRHKNLWIVCEDKNEARDNGYWIFKYIKEHHPEQEIVYAIKHTSPDINKVTSIGHTVEYGTLNHWILYLASTKKISSQKAGNPNAAIFYFLEVYGILKDKRVFLQHGVICNELKWLFYDVTKMKRFICGAYPEYQYIVSTYGYPKGNVCYTGLCRFDGLHDLKSKRVILIMPTWREWIADEDDRLKKYEGTTNIPETNYFVSWVDFIKDERIKTISQKFDVKFIFFPHRNMQKYMSYFPESNEFIEVASAKDYGVQELLKMSAMMITDYSSVFFDMLYMKKPVSFYQFDYDRFRMGQYEEGYFRYDDTPFGNSYQNKMDVFADIEDIISRDFAVSEEYLKAHKEYFPLYDKDNCKRVHKVIKEL